MIMAEKKAKIQVNSYRKTIILSIVACFLLLISNTAIWMNNQVFDSQAFTNTVTTSLTSESSRTAMSQEITDRIFQDRPIVKRVAGDFSTKIISGLLATDQFRNVLTPAVERIQAYATSSNQEDVVIELAGIKDVIVRITNIAENAGREVNVEPENIPDQITLLEANNVPDLYKIGVVFLWLAPVSFLIAILLLAYPYFKHLNDNKKTVALQGSIITLFGLLGLLVGPLFKPPVLANVSGPNGRVIIGNLYDAFISTFNSQTILLALVGVLMILISTIWIGYPYAKNVISTRKKIN
jgi:hypothetical protein